MRIYEHGISVGADDPWEPEGLTVVATTDPPIYANFDLTLVDSAGRSLTGRIVKVLSNPSGGLAADFFEEGDVRDGLLAMAYHFGRLVNLCSNVARLFEDTYPDVRHLKGNTHSPPIYYEADALLSAGRRWYENVRRLLWKHYGRAESRPRSIRTLLPRDDVLPSSYMAELRASWDTYGELLTAYRDCLMHYDPMDNGGKTAWTSRWDGRWGVSVRLPANPTTRSRARYDFENGPDVVTYGHELLCHLTDLAERTENLPKIRAHLA